MVIVLAHFRKPPLAPPEVACGVEEKASVNTACHRHDPFGDARPGGREAGIQAHVAQLVEHILGKDEVSGSIPLVGSILATGRDRVVLGLPADLFFHLNLH